MAGEWKYHCVHVPSHMGHLLQRLEIESKLRMRTVPQLLG